MQTKSLRYGNVNLKEDWVIEDTSVKDACILTAAILDEILSMLYERDQKVALMNKDLQAGKIARIEEHDLYQECKNLMGQIRDLEAYSNTWDVNRPKGVESKVVSDSQQG